MSYENFDWQKMVSVCVLDRYIKEQHLSAVINNKHKEVRDVICHLQLAFSTREYDEDQDLVIEETEVSRSHRLNLNAERVFVSDDKNCYNPIEQKELFCFSNTETTFVTDFK